MLAKLLRLSVLAATIAVSVASTTTQGQAPQYQPSYVGGPGYSEGEGPGPTPSGPPYSCTQIRTVTTAGTMCVATADRCERERQDAERDGAQTTPCRPQAPVSCFQLTGDPNPSMEVCAASPEDCDLWRLIDRDKNGRTGAACEWRHGEAIATPAQP
jgi:hypothetical protein